jgi:hypothetical protein
MRLTGWADRSMLGVDGEDLQVERAVEAERRRGSIHWFVPADQRPWRGASSGSAVAGPEVVPVRANTEAVNARLRRHVRCLDLLRP